MSNALRLERHCLTERAEPGALVDVARRVCGLHAQVLSATDLQLWARVRDHGRDDLSRALWQDRTLVKTWLMRGTLHAVPADDLPLYVGALDNRGEYVGAWLRAFETTATEMERLIAAIGDALDGESLTRAELIAAVGPKVGKSAAKRLSSGWGEFLKPASRRGVLCFGPSRGQNVTFVRPDQWIGGWRTVERDEARTELLQRFLSSFAPVSADDYERWLGSTRRIREPWEELAEELVEVEPKRFALAGDVEQLSARPKGVNVLGAFDPYVLFPHNDRPVGEAHRDHVYRTAGWISQVIVVRGRVSAVWTHKKNRRKLETGMEPFAAFSATTARAIDRELASLAAFLGAER
jgi:DNA glycosylase AlkZ-like